MAESIIGLFKTELIRHGGPRRTLDAVELATLDWVDWFTNRRLLEPIANIRRPKPRPPTTAPRSPLRLPDASTHLH